MTRVPYDLVSNPAATFTPTTSHQEVVVVVVGIEIGGIERVV